MLDRAQLKQTLKLAWPISLQNILVTLLSMIDVIMVSHLGDSAVAAVGIGNRVQFVVMVIVLGLAWGVGILAAQYKGAGTTSKIRQIILMAIVYVILSLAPVIALNYFFADSVLSLGSSDQTVIALGQSYLWITMPSLLFVAVILIYENALRSINQVKLPMILSAISIALNVVLNYWLINGGLGIEALGVDGAAWATTLSRLFQLLLLIYMLAKLKHELSYSPEDIATLKQKSEWSKLLKLVVPMMASFGLWSVGSFCYQLIYGNMGTTELAVLSMLLPVEGLFLSLFFGLASACSIFVGQQLGADKFDQAWASAKTFSLFSPLIASVLGLLMYFLSDLVLMPYQDMPEQTLQLAKQVLMVLALGAWIKVGNMVLSMGILRAGGDNSYCVKTDFIGMWVVSLPLTFIAAFYWGLPLFWVVIVTFSEEITKLILFGKRVIGKLWMRNLTN